MSTTKYLTLALLVSAVAMPHPAGAGFQWVPPESVERGTVVSTLPVVPSPQPTIIQGPNVISPVIVQGMPPIASPQSAPALPAVIAPVPFVSGVPVSAAATDVASTGGGQAISGQPDMVVSVNPPSVKEAPTVLPPPSAGAILKSTQGPVVADAAKEEIVRGFASQVPLSIALKQILPQGYKFSADADVSMDSAVSFKGGKPWRETLVESLRAVGLSVLEVGQSVRIRRASLGASVDQASVPSAPQESGAVGVLPLVAAPDVKKVMVVSSPSVLPASAVATGVGEPPAVARDAKTDWKAERGDSLRTILTAWCKRSGAEIQWLAEYDYPLFASVDFNGTFEQAVRAILEGFSGANPQPIARLHVNPTMGQMVLVVRVRGNGDSN